MSKVAALPLVVLGLGLCLSVVWAQGDGPKGKASLSPEDRELELLKAEQSERRANIQKIALGLVMAMHNRDEKRRNLIDMCRHINESTKFIGKL